MDYAKELARLEGTNFFANKPESMPRYEWLWLAAKKEAARWGQMDPVANTYIQCSNYARVADR